MITQWLWPRKHQKTTPCKQCLSVSALLLFFNHNNLLSQGLNPSKGARGMCVGLGGIRAEAMPRHEDKSSPVEWSWMHEDGFSGHSSWSGQAEGTT